MALVFIEPVGAEPQAHLTFLRPRVIWLRSAMPQMPCPVCGTTTPCLLEGISADAEVKYYRCPSCAHVWTVLSQEA
jgi:transposase-like protein